MNEALKQEAEQIRKADRFGAFVAVRPDPLSMGEGPLHGLRVAVKDNIAVAGLPFTAGHPLFANRLAAHDAQAVQRLRLAGARVVGVTQTDAGGFGVTTPGVVNPVAPGLTAGGSSGGSAAAVAAGIVDIGLGTDTGGSVRIPAACCGLFALKPTHGAIPLDGVWPMAPGLDHVGLITREFETLVRGAQALLPGLQSPRVGRPTFGVDMSDGAELDADMAQSFSEVINRMRSDGFEIVPVTLPGTRIISAAHGGLVLAQTRAVYAGLWPLQPEDLGGRAYQALRAAYLLDQVAIDEAQASSVRIVNSLKRAFDLVDAILTPTLPIKPPPVGVHSVMLNGRKTSVLNALISQTCLGNLAGIPALTMPVSAGAGAGAPFSLQMLAPLDCDAKLLQYGAQLKPMFAPLPPLA